MSGAIAEVKGLEEGDELLMGKRPQLAEEGIGDGGC